MMMTVKVELGDEPRQVALSAKARQWHKTFPTRLMILCNLEIYYHSLSVSLRHRCINRHTLPTRVNKSTMCFMNVPEYVHLALLEFSQRSRQCLTPCVHPSLRQVQYPIWWCVG